MKSLGLEIQDRLPLELCILWHSLVDCVSNAADWCYRAELGDFFVLTCFSNVEPRADQPTELENLGELFL